jgi:hypothetical protein
MSDKRKNFASISISALISFLSSLTPSKFKDFITSPINSFLKFALSAIISFKLLSGLYKKLKLSIFSIF